MNSGNLEIAAYGAAARRPQLGKGALSRLFALTVPVAWRATAGRLGHSSCLTLAGFVCLPLRPAFDAEVYFVDSELR